MKRLHIFRAGTHTAVSGTTVSFSEADVAGIAASYDPAAHEAPIVVGHPKLDAPAYGWVEGMTANGQDLEATPKQVAAEFSEAVAEGRYKKISAAFYLPGSKAHPLGADAEHPYLKHVGFLGGAAPAIRGLQPVEFAADEEGVEVLEFAASGTVEFGYAERRMWSVMRRLRDFIVDKFSVEEADRVVSTDELDWAIERDVREEMAAVDQSPGFAEGESPDSGRLGEPSQPITIEIDPMNDQTAEFAERETQLTERERQIQEREERIALAERERQHSEHVAFAEGLADDGARILPRHVPVVAAVLDALAGGDDTQTVAFAEAEEQLPLDAALRQLLEELPEQVAYGEHARPELDEDTSTAEFAAPAGYEVDQAGLAVDRKARAYMRQHEGTSYVDAVRAVSHR